MNLDHLEQLLETMSPEEIRSKFAGDLEEHPECEAMLQQFEQLDDQLFALKSFDQAPEVKVPRRGILPKLTQWMLPIAAVLILGLLFGSGLLKEGLDQLPSAAKEAAVEPGFERDARQDHTEFDDGYTATPGNQPVETDALEEMANADEGLFRQNTDDAVVMVEENEASSELVLDSPEAPVLKPKRKPGQVSPQKPASNATPVGSEQDSEAGEVNQPKKDREVMKDSVEEKIVEPLPATTPAELEESKVEAPAEAVSSVGLLKEETLQAEPQAEKGQKSVDEAKPSSPVGSSQNAYDLNEADLNQAPTLQTQGFEDRLRSGSGNRLQKAKRDAKKENSAGREEQTRDADGQQSHELWMDTFRVHSQKGGDWLALFSADAQITSQLGATAQKLDPQAFETHWRAQGISPGWNIVSSKMEGAGYVFVLSVLVEAKGNEPMLMSVDVVLNSAWKCQRLKIKWVTPR